MLKIITFKAEHLECMDIRDHEKGFSLDALSALENGLSYTIIDDGRIIFCGGFKMVADRVAELWLLPSIYMNEHPMKIAKNVVKWVKEIRELYNLKRIQTISLDDELHKRWLGFLGFKEEEKRTGFMFDKDYIMWGREWA